MDTPADTDDGVFYTGMLCPENGQEEKKER